MELQKTEAEGTIKEVRISVNDSSAQDSQTGSLSGRTATLLKSSSKDKLKTADTDVKEKDFVTASKTDAVGPGTIEPSDDDLPSLINRPLNDRKATQLTPKLTPASTGSSTTHNSTGTDNSIETDNSKSYQLCSQNCNTAGGGRSLRIAAEVAAFFIGVVMWRHCSRHSCPANGELAGIILTWAGLGTLVIGEPINCILNKNCK